MIIYYSGADGHYGEPADSVAFSANVMMTFDKLRTDQSRRARFWEVLEQRRNGAEKRNEQ